MILLLLHEEMVRFAQLNTMHLLNGILATALRANYPSPNLAGIYKKPSLLPLSL